MNPLFASDNVTSACPEVMDALIEANSGIAGSYGDDEWSSILKTTLSKVFETEVEVYLAVTGTASNALALSALTPVFGKIYCHELSHINTDECGAPELFTGGAKLNPMRSSNGRISASELDEIVRGYGNVHVTQPAVVSITQSCETGTVYPLEEIQEISEMISALEKKVYGSKSSKDLGSLYAKRGILYSEIDDFYSAENDFNESVFLFPNDKTYESIANNYFNNSLYKEAGDSYSELLKNNDTAEYYFKRGLCYAYQDMYDKSLDDFEKAIQMNYEIEKIKELISKINEIQSI